MRTSEVLGFAAGGLLAPVAAVAALVRRARALHPDGVVYRAEVLPDASSGPEAAVAQRLAGPALVRFSAGLSRMGTERHPDVLGVAIRFRKSARPSGVPAEGDQDLLFATVRRAAWLLPALFTTNVRSYLWDDYYAVAKFETPELGLVKWRIVTPRIPSLGIPRERALDRAVKQGTAVLELQCRGLRPGAAYEPVVRIRLIERVAVDQQVLRFSPFRSGRGIVPRGFLNAIRILPYMASQLAHRRASAPAEQAPASAPRARAATGADARTAVPA